MKNIQQDERTILVFAVIGAIAFFGSLWIKLGHVRECRERGFSASYCWWSK